MAPTISARPVRPAELYEIFAENTCPPATVYGVAGAMLAPVALEKVMVPVQDAAVPVDGLVALFNTLIWMVSVLARPTGGNTESRVRVAMVPVPWAATRPALDARRRAVIKKLGEDKVHLMFRLALSQTAYPSSRVTILLGS